MILFCSAILAATFIMAKVGLLVLICALLAPVWSGPAISSTLLDNSGQASLDIVSTRDPHFLMLALISISNDKCSTTNPAHPTGICYAENDCKRLNGTADGSCGNGFATCCYFARTCDQKTITNTTSFVNPGYPGGSKTAAGCQMAVDLVSKNVCQLRLDFQRFDLAPPNAAGVCVTDFLTITGSLSDAMLPKLCGNNTGQHIYLSINPAGDGPTFKITTKTGDFKRKWNIIVTQIECNSESEAPDGCLQYYTSPSGVIKSFNYKKPTAAEVASEGVNHHLSDLDYSVCLSSRDGSCGISWRPDEESKPYHFMMTGDAPVSTSTIGEPTASLNQADCKDFIMIPNSSGAGDRYCGLGFPAQVTSSFTPFLLRVKTDSDEDGDQSNAGFSLKYEMNKC